MLSLLISARRLIGSAPLYIKYSGFLIQIKVVRLREDLRVYALFVGGINCSDHRAVDNLLLGFYSLGRELVLSAHLGAIHRNRDWVAYKYV
jgi:hypothetical protein